MLTYGDDRRIHDGSSSILFSIQASSIKRARDSHDEHHYSNLSTTKLIPHIAFDDYYFYDPGDVVPASALRNLVGGESHHALDQASSPSQRSWSAEGVAHQW